MAKGGGKLDGKFRVEKGGDGNVNDDCDGGIGSSDDADDYDEAAEVDESEVIAYLPFNLQDGDRLYLRGKNVDGWQLIDTAFSDM